MIESNSFARIVAGPSIENQIRLICPVWTPFDAITAFRTGSSRYREVAGREMPGLRIEARSTRGRVSGLPRMRVVRVRRRATMKQCRNCRAVVSPDYVRVFSPDGDHVYCCPQCDDMIRGDDGRPRARQPVRSDGGGRGA